MPPSSAPTTITPACSGDVISRDGSQWRHLPDEIILVGQARAGSVVASRINGVLAGILEILPEIAGSCPVVQLDGDGLIGQNAEPDARTELRQPKTPLVASVGYFPERYGDAMIRLALDILSGKAVPPAVFVKHQVITRDNVDHFYPNDSLMPTSPSY